MPFFHWDLVLVLPHVYRVLLDQVEHWQSYLALVNMILSCTGIPGHYPVNETTSSLTLTFWYTLQVRYASLSPFFENCENENEYFDLDSVL